MTVKDSQTASSEKEQNYVHKTNGKQFKREKQRISPFLIEHDTEERKFEDRC